MFALIASLPLAAQPRTCWEMKPGYNAISRLVAAPGKERRPDIFFFGETGSADACRGACEAEGPGCAAFAWMGPGKRGVFGGADKWARGCYGRGASTRTMVPDKERVSGVKARPVYGLEALLGDVDPDSVQQQPRHACQAPPFASPCHEPLSAAPGAAPVAGASADADTDSRAGVPLKTINAVVDQVNSGKMTFDDCVAKLSSLGAAAAAQQQAAQAAQQQRGFAREARLAALQREMEALQREVELKQKLAELQAKEADPATGHSAHGRV
ncbi:hypothetical protein EMIHUDRAFT_223981 [Emiliania huxleyi CCMP1516]|uniref:Apple domain-containing protein n=2 Tax=Emiliania huxleyi TaxID=2903 RepID=A0A0D3KSY9_EMIH1|nr:hypothetical protein EMIHUDRAFT_223981 [Emiliania huxleyi CCMP1516]EOD38874.1 hypothetical protein EMIHUDRAFT_223981 [Emiliania huxleyi CCMP1516]|eukprot:XP_005791303.1 hypothetical protein EMIHUDRAFT_223981 [Emiliania huxleyi CCMP1516]